MRQKGWRLACIPMFLSLALAPGCSCVGNISGDAADESIQQEDAVLEEEGGVAADAGDEQQLQSDEAGPSEDSAVVADQSDGLDGADSDPGPAAHQVTEFTTNGSDIGRYLKFEATFQISRSFVDDSMLPYYPYDASDAPDMNPGRKSPYGVDGISIDATFIAPSGKELVVPAFYYRDYVRTATEVNPTNNTSWKVRFAPLELGQYSYFLTIQDRSGSTRYPAQGTLSLNAVASSSKGFVRVSPRDPRFLEFDNGQSYIPIGGGHQWWRCCGKRSWDNEQAFDQFGEHGINLTRVWDQNDSYSLTVEGHFDAYQYPDDFNPVDNGVDISTIPKGTQMNQRGNYEEDKIIEAAERNGIYIQLCSHGDAAWIWDASIYEESWNPNPVTFNDPKHLAYWKRNFRYRVARWGYSTSILAWELWNEHGHILSGTQAYDFYQAYSAYQLQIDPFRHLRTTSQGSQAFSPGLWSSSAFDLANYHDYMMAGRYPPGLFDDEANFVYRFAQCLRTPTGGDSGCSLGIGDGSSWQGGPKPFIWGELDTGTTNWNEANPQPIADHNVIWAGLFSPLGMSPIDWYWEAKDAFLADKYDWAKIAHDFFGDLDYAGQGFVYLSTDDVRLTSLPLLQATPAKLRVLAMRSSNGQLALAWAQHQDYTWGKSGTTPTPFSGSFTIPSMADGQYQVQYTNTHDGTVTSGGIVNAAGGNVIIPVTNLENDVAIRVNKSKQAHASSTSLKEVGQK